MKRFLVKIGLLMPKSLRDKFLETDMGQKIKMTLISEYRAMPQENMDLHSRVLILENIVDDLIDQVIEHNQNCSHK